MASKGKVLQTVINISGEISPSLGKSLKSVTDKLDGVNVKALAVGASIAAIGVGTAVAVGKAVGELAELGDAYNSALNDISATTGLVGDELAGMGEVMKDVYGSNFGESMEDVADGVSEVYRQTGLVGDALAETTKAAYALSDTFDYDVSESARAAKALMTNFGIEGQAAMDMIASGAQNGLDYSGELLDSISEYSVQFAKLGFSADDMFSIFQQGADSGAWNLDKVGDAIKEFSIRSIDSSATTIHAFEALGLDADEMMATFAAGGDNASVAFQGVLTALTSMDDQVQRDLIGVELFGTMWEDLGIDAMTAMADLQTGAYATGDAIAGIMDVKYDNLTDAFEAVKRQAEVSLLPMASTIANAFTDIAPIIGDMFEDLGPIIEQTTEEMMPFVEEFLAGAIDLLQEVMPLVANLASSLMPILLKLVSSLLPPLLDLAEALIPPLIEILDAILPPIVGILTSILPILVQIANIVLPILVQLISGLLPIITPVLDVLLQLLSDVVMPLLDALMPLVNALLPAIGPFLGVIADMLAPVLDMLQPLADLLATVVGWIAKVVGWVADGLTWVVDLVFGDKAGEVAETAELKGYYAGGFTDGPSLAGEDPNYPTEAVISFNPIYHTDNVQYWLEAGEMLGITLPQAILPDLPMYAAGGFTNGVSIAGEDGTEAVISFNPTYRSQNLSYWAEAGRMLGADTSDFSLSGESSGDYYEMGGVTFSPQITVYGHADKESIMEAIEAEYPEFMDMLDEFLDRRRATVYG